MKRTQYLERKSLFWSRMLGLLIAFAIVAVLVFGGVKNLMGDLSAAHEALAASQYELGKTQNELDHTRSDLAAAQQNIQDQSLVLRKSASALEYAGEHIRQLTDHRDHLTRRLSAAANQMARGAQLLAATDNARRAAEAKLEHYLQQPKLSMVMTTERHYQASKRELFAASQVRMMAEGPGGAMFYAGSEVFHEVEKHVAYAERTQVVLTQTGPGDDVLRCLRDGCAMILAAGESAMQMESYAYQSEYVSSEMLLTEGRRGRRPGRRR